MRSASVDDRSVLAALRGDQSVAALCTVAGVDLAEFKRARDALLRERLPPRDQRLTGGVSRPVQIARDYFGIPHVFAAETGDLYFGLGFAMAQDRLWEMDYYRRRGVGRLAEILGPREIAEDVAHQTVGIERIARREVELIDPATRSIVEAFVAGVNRAIEVAGDALPIEFDILEYRPAPWSIADVIASMRGFWWARNGRLQNLVIGEAARLLPAGPLRNAYLSPEFPDERIVPPGSPYPPADLATAPLRPPLGGADDATIGSNNWAVGGGRTASGAGILASDPHVPLVLPGTRYECRLKGPEDDAAGSVWIGAPGIVFGRNPRAAWGITNSNTSLRDLYAEEIDPSDPNRYRDGDAWRAFDEREIVVKVRGQAPTRAIIRETVRGPIVNHLIPKIVAAGDPPLALRWVGQEHVEDLRAMIALGRSRDWTSFRRALSYWAVPAYNFVFADAAGNVGYQLAARVPIRSRVVAGFRAANNPDDVWRGYIPFDALPRLENPARGFVVSANNAPAPNDFPYPVYGAYGSGSRAIRIREVIEQSRPFDVARCAELQNDTLSVRARALVPALVRRLAGSGDPDVRLFCGELAGWDFRYDLETAAPTLFELFMPLWRRRVAAARFPAHLVDAVAAWSGVAARLILADDLDWLNEDKAIALAACARDAVAEARRRLGPDPARWRWGEVHAAHFTHPLSNEASADVFDIGPVPVPGGPDVVRNAGSARPPRFDVTSGAEYRLIVDLADPSRLSGTQHTGQSGQPLSPHYADQFGDWTRGERHTLELTHDRSAVQTTAAIRIDP